MKPILLSPTPSRRVLWAIQSRIEQARIDHGEAQALDLAIRALATIDALPPPAPLQRRTPR